VWERDEERKREKRRAADVGLGGRGSTRERRDKGATQASTRRIMPQKREGVYGAAGTTCDVR
jgi:hypothetical protein